MNKDTLRQLANALSVAVALTVNILASTLPLNGQNTGEISDRFQVYFVPAGYVFAIWGIIYIGWIAFAIYQFGSAQKESPRLRNLGYLFALSGIFNAAWLFCWHYNLFGFSVLVMLTLLGLLIASYLKLNVGRTAVSNTEKWSVDVPFSVYLGWISVATVANVTDYLYFINWTGFGIAPQIWAVILLVIASVLALAMTVTRRDSGYAFVLVWSFAGIAQKQADTALVANSAWVATVFVLGLAIYSIIQRRRKTA
ncbi:tryptophan-rich sensory protein [Candidatus Villigracilis saccharophilus]|uniref:tryptophan-rich sensory protein n=1 Tax=Candidatus Villigracilis saccharophilus TaxID=3140684 RepID=UPI00313703C6|nr:tryptophan-rich sensory protein [Anaerolineales bacterium]